MKRFFTPLVCALCLVPAAARSNDENTPRFGRFGIDLTARDISAKPGDDFWWYANGAWSQRTPIPANIDAVGVAPQQSRNMETLLHGLFETVSRDAHADAYSRLIGDFYVSWMDEAAIDGQGLKPAIPYLDAINAARDPVAIQRLMASPPYSGLIAIDVVRDPQDPRVNIIRVGQGELGMPRDYYLRQGAQYDAYRVAYAAYLTALLDGAGLRNSAERVRRVIELETLLAGGFWGAAERRDLSRNDRRMSAADLRASVPGLDWNVMLGEAVLKHIGSVVVGEDGALLAFSRALHDTPLAVWQDYLRVRFLSDYANFLPSRFADAHFVFYDRTLSGIAEPAPRWRRAVTLVNDKLGEAVSSVYAKRFLDQATTEQVRTIFEDLRSAFRARIERCSWMDEVTRKGALAKVETLAARIGSPEGTPDYSGLKLSRDRALDNAINIARFQASRAQRQLENPDAIPEWPFRSQDGNGFYYASANSVLLAGGLLFPPFFDRFADPAVNYGAIGAFIGHEMGHAFDDHGSRYDAGGKEVDWWSPASRASFEVRTAALKEQYGRYEALPDLKVDGSLTLGENIADLGGLEAAYDAYKLYETRKGGGKVIDGLTPAQRFFLSNAQMRRTMLREDVQRQLATFDTHAPPRLRVNGVMRNMDSWYAAFGIASSDLMYLAPDRRIHIW